MEQRSQTCHGRRYRRRNVAMKVNYGALAGFNVAPIVVSVFLGTMLVACSTHAVQTRRNLSFVPTMDCNRPSSQSYDPDKQFLPEVPTAETQTRIAVHVTSAGRADRARIEKSSGFPQLDFAEEKIAMDYVYSPATKHCKPVASWYVFTATYTSNYDEGRNAARFPSLPEPAASRPN